MSYRTFERPPARGWTIDQWANWAYEQGVMHLVAPSQEGVCEICHAPTTATYSGGYFSRCRQCQGQQELACLLPISYSEHDALESMIWRAKNDEEHRWLNTALASVLWIFMRDHLACLEQNYGHVDTITFLPSHPSKRGSWDHMRHLHASIAERDLDARWAPDLLTKAAITDADDRRASVSAETFTLTEGHSVVDEHVLLVDDTWTTGASLRSAALTLRRAGARQVSALTIGRQLSRPGEWDAADRFRAEGLASPAAHPDDTLCALHEPDDPGQLLAFVTNPY